MEAEKITPEQRGAIYRAICSSMYPDDTPPSRVIAEDYNGDEDAYLRSMAKWHNIKLD